MNIAERALAAHEAEVEAKRLNQEAEFVRIKAKAVDAILRSAERFGIELHEDNLERGFNGWTAAVQIDEDASLSFTKPDREDVVEVRVKPADQLYWDLPPGQNKKEKGGGTYGCYNLGAYWQVGTLAQLGEAIAKIRSARFRWRAKHGVEEVA